MSSTLKSNYHHLFWLISSVLLICNNFNNVTCWQEQLTDTNDQLKEQTILSTTSQVMPNKSDNQTVIIVAQRRNSSKLSFSRLIEDNLTTQATKLELQQKQLALDGKQILQVQVKTNKNETEYRNHDSNNHNKQKNNNTDVADRQGRSMRTIVTEAKDLVVFLVPKRRHVNQGLVREIKPRQVLLKDSNKILDETNKSRGSAMLNDKLPVIFKDSDKFNNVNNFIDNNNNNNNNNNNDGEKVSVLNELSLAEKDKQCNSNKFARLITNVAKSVSRRYSSIKEHVTASNIILGSGIIATAIPLVAFVLPESMLGFPIKALFSSSSSLPNRVDKQNAESVTRLSLQTRIDNFMGWLERSTQELPSFPRLHPQECFKRTICEAHNQPTKFGALGFVLRMFFPANININSTNEERQSTDDMEYKVINKYKYAAAYGRDTRLASNGTNTVACKERYEDCLVSLLEVTQILMGKYLDNN